MNITSRLKIRSEGHRDLEFVDINLDTDIALYLDPTLINSLSSGWCQEASKVINSYFDNVFECCQNKNYSRLRTLVEFGKEPNETKLGQSIFRSCGKGSKPESLYKIFKSVSDNYLIENGLVRNAQELYVYLSEILRKIECLIL